MSNKKTLSFLKKEIQGRYKGRGNTWVKIPFESEAFSFIDDLLKLKHENETREYKKHIHREGFAWIRFIKVEGKSIDSIKSVFEIRVRGSKEDHPDYRISFNDNIIKDLPLLGNTPLKLQLESEIKGVKSSVVKKIKNLSAAKKEEIFSWETRIEEVTEAPLSKPTKKELKEWTDFLKATGLLKEEF